MDFEFLCCLIQEVESWSDSPFGSGFIVKFSFLYLSTKKLTMADIEILLIYVGKSIM
jgi:hypothetical protein